uniref:Glutamate (NMDA) receptor-associated protein 1-like protein n=1 Tax=Callorhinchus milii TaxID=7868 RepID=V9L4Y3_CALMI
MMEPGAKHSSAGNTRSPKYDYLPQSNYTNGQEIFSRSLEDKVIRLSFIRKVFVLLAVQLLLTLAVVCVCTFTVEVKSYVQTHSAIYFTSYAIFLLLLITLTCCGEVRRRYPWNILCLAALTLSFSYMVGTIASYYDTVSVLIALGSTTAVCFAIIVFASQTRIDFTYLYTFLLVLSIVFFMFGIFLIFFSSKIMQILYGSLGALLFSLFLTADIQLVLGSKRYDLSSEEYVFGAMILYLDIVNIFIYLLMLTGASRE